MYRSSNKKFVAGFILHLVNIDGEVVATTETAYDGYYIFEFVPIGEYSVKADEQYGIDVSENKASITKDNLSIYGYDLFIKDLEQNK